MQRKRHAFVTGCASGIGRRTVTVLLARGYRVTATDFNEPGLHDAATADRWDPARVELISLDVRDPVGWEAALSRATARFGFVDVAMNIAGMLQPAWVYQITPADVDRHFDVNTKGVVHGTRIMAKHMLVSGSGGHIINVASLAGIAPIPGISLYSASKHAVRAFSIAAAYELADKGIAVSVVCPDAVATPMLDLQESYEQAALTFSGPRTLSAGEVAEALCGRVIRYRPLELSIPWSRGLIARLAAMFPGVAGWLVPYLRGVGERVQRRRRSGGR